MSEIHQNICPIMSRAVTFPTGLPYPEEQHEDRLIDIECLGKDCKWYISNEGECAIKWQALMVTAIFEREDD